MKGVAVMIEDRGLMESNLDNIEKNINNAAAGFENTDNCGRGRRVFEVFRATYEIMDLSAA